MSNENDNPKSTEDTLLGYAAMLVGFVIGYYAGFLVFLFFLASVAIGIWFAKWYAKRQKISFKLVNFIIWSNILTWFLPPLGLLTGTIAIQFSIDFKDKLKSTKKHKILGVIGIVLSLANAALGVYMQIHG